MNARQEDEAVFWCGLLTSVLFEKLEKGEECQRLRELSQQEVVFPAISESLNAVKCL